MTYKLVIPRISGGIGNQLFIYAAAYRLASVNGAELALDSISGFVRDEYKMSYQLEHFCISCRKATATELMEPFSRIRRFTKRYRSKRMPFSERDYLVQEGVDFDNRLLAFKPRGTIYLEGYWQSEDYFKDVESKIRSELRIIPPTDKVNQNMVAHIRSINAVAVHIRFFDSTSRLTRSVDVNNTLSNYYQRAFKFIQEQVKEAHFFIFSDRPEAIRANISFPNDCFTIVGHNKGDAMAYADLWLMTQCKYFIVANSTFSWWGAWLSEFPKKIVIAPGFENRDGSLSWGFRGLLPDQWVKL